VKSASESAARPVVEAAADATRPVSAPAPAERLLARTGRWPAVLVLMGSVSDWPTMVHAAECLTELDVDHGCSVVSAHRTPERLSDVGRRAAERGVQVIVAGAGGAAHLPGMLAAHTRLPVFGVPIEGRVLSGLDSLLSIVQMPRGVPVGTLAIGSSGAVNAALLAAAVLALHDSALAARLDAYRAERSALALAEPLPCEHRFEP
jgi:5-(carboxyamino)imidazole ribonucleotide mutase